MLTRSSRLFILASMIEISTEVMRLELPSFCVIIFFVLMLSAHVDAFFGLTSQRAEFEDVFGTILPTRKRNVILDSNQLPGNENGNDNDICRKFQLNKRQRALCRRREGYPSTLAKSFRLAVFGCQNQFRNNRWNCSLGPARKLLLKKAYPETSYLYAITAASLVHSFARSCSRGHLADCTCEEFNSNLIPQRYHGQRWTWSGCSDNVSAAKELVKRFATISPNKSNRNFVNNIARHNMNVGLKVLRTTIKRRCKCHGISGSCAVKSCWNLVTPFHRVEAALSEKFVEAVHKPAKKLPFTWHHEPDVQNSLWYRETSPDFCALNTPNLVSGRECVPDLMISQDVRQTSVLPYCKDLCCANGYRLSIQMSSDRCNCIAKNFDVRCSYCKERKIRYFCN